ncbi:MAG TPA: hypothetical protein VHM89_00260 [Acidimicrobiales bacterium]|nr:hypothetical protein [Acidimicrobiales bacterium]
MGVTLTEILETWARDAERMHGGAALGVVVTDELLGHLVEEQGVAAPLVAGISVLAAATQVPTDSGLPSLDEMVEIAGPDRVSIYVGVEPEASTFPLGLDPAMPVVFVPVPPQTLQTHAELEMYNRLRWYGLGPSEAFGGSSSGAS